MFSFLNPLDMDAMLQPAGFLSPLPNKLNLQQKKDQRKEIPHHDDDCSKTRRRASAVSAEDLILPLSFLNLQQLSSSKSNNK
jgi:hypothetical protein